MEFRLGHRPALDGVRGFAILTVMGVHTGGPFVEGGFLSVDLFFVLSGFLITSVLLDEWQRTGGIRLGRFYARRALRLLPGLLALLAVLAVWSRGLPDRASAIEVWREMLFTFFYSANWALAFGAMPAMGVLGHAWTLAIEEQFYLVWPALLLAMLKAGLSRATLLRWTAAAAAASGLLRFAMWSGGASIDRLFFGFDTRCDTLLFGCLAAVWVTLPARAEGASRRRVLRVAAIAALGAMLVFARREAGYMYCGGFTVAAASAALLLVEVVERPQTPLARVLAWRPLVHVGNISYGLYLWHWPVFLALGIGYPEWSATRLNATRFAVAFILAQMSSTLVEQPALRWKKRWS